MLIPHRPGRPRARGWRPHGATRALLLAGALLACGHHGGHADGGSGDVDTPAVSRTVEAACGQCQFDLAGDGCDLAVRFDGDAYFVEGTGIDDHGDSHADDGFCNAIRQAEVSGRVEDGRFIAGTFTLLPEDDPAGG